MSKPRQALILIHGIGEQRPMETLRGFVDGVLDQPPSTSLHRLLQHVGCRGFQER
jgi:hypothetical protein